MSHLKFNCPHCGQHLECDEKHAGREISCPACKAKAMVPASKEKKEPVMQKSGMTFVPESWRKPGSGAAGPPSRSK